MYPGGSNEPEGAHAEEVLWASASIRPLDSCGRDDPAGLIVLTSIGMSNATQEFAAFEQAVGQVAERNNRLVLVNGALSSHDLRTILDPTKNYWTLHDIRLQQAGVSREQVQVVWIKNVFSDPATLSFPAHAVELKNGLAELVLFLKARFPNLAIAYITSRSYGGYSGLPNRSEPLSYETGFGVKWLIEEQISSPGGRLRHSGADAPAPVIAWGPYLWANGVTPRSDGLMYVRGDYLPDGVHPSLGGRAKIAELMIEWLYEPSQWSWFGRRWDGGSVVSTAVSADASVNTAMPSANFGANTSLRVSPAGQFALLRFDGLPELDHRLIHAKLVVFPGDIPTAFSINSIDDTDWDEQDITAANAPMYATPSITAVPDPTDYGGVTNSVSADVTRSLRGMTGGSVGFAITPIQGEMSGSFFARESGFPSRLELLFSDGEVKTPGDINLDGRLNIFDVLAMIDLIQSEDPAADITCNGIVGTEDIVELITRIERPGATGPGGSGPAP